MVNKAVQKALAALWTDRVTVYQNQKVTDPVTHITDFREVAILEDQPCKLSFETLAAAEGDPAAAVSQAVKLFLSPDVVIPAGCKVIVTRQGRTFTYASSGEPGVFRDHQEISLTLFKGWA